MGQEFIVEKQTGYTIMSNYHLRDRSISLKAKGLLSHMLSLPEEWNYSIKGLVAIEKEGYDAIRNILQELEEAGYILRKTVRDNGKIVGTKYYVFMKPKKSKEQISDGEPEKNSLLEDEGNSVIKSGDEDVNICETDPIPNLTEKSQNESLKSLFHPETGFPITDNPMDAEGATTKRLQNKPSESLFHPETGFPLTAKPITGEPLTGNPDQINTKQIITKGINNNLSIHHSPSINHPVALKDDREKVESDDMIDGMDGIVKNHNPEPDVDERQRWREYFEHKLNVPFMLTPEGGCEGREKELDSIIELLVETMCTNSDVVKIGGEYKPIRVVQSKFMKLTRDHIAYVVESLGETTSKIRNIRAYLLTTLYNAPDTWVHHWNAWFNHDYYGTP